MSIETIKMIWKKKPAAYVIEFSKDSTKEYIENVLKNYRVIEKVGWVYIVDEKINIC